MKRKIFNLMLIATMLVAKAYAQGIDFNKSLSWTALKEKAGRENKIIFVEVGATWCAPCHLMERTVFTEKLVGDFYNQHFINVSIQSDKTKDDKDYTRSWYKDAEEIIKNYDVGAYPSYLFISPDGEIISRGLGVMSPADFLATGKLATAPNQNLNAEKMAFENRTMNIKNEGIFSLLLYKLGDYSGAIKVAKDYKARLLDTASDEELKKPDNLKLIYTFQTLVQPKDTYFNLLYKDERKIDSLLKNPGFSYRLTNTIIAYQLVRPALYDDKANPLPKAPDWSSIEHRVLEDYSSERARDIITYQKYQYYYEVKDWPSACQSGIDLVEKADLKRSDARFVTRNEVASTTLFLHSDDKKQLEIGLGWMRFITAQQPNNFTYLDTYSCLLYKLGNKSDAIAVEQKAIKIAADSELQDKEDYLKTFHTNLQKMNAGKPTWQ